ncbi:MAG TPA: hypothetical protein VFD91_17320, partial [Mariniphaga sp.]|nr:hypothetical protein [Mariniphaga sp.]
MKFIQITTLIAILICSVDLYSQQSSIFGKGSPEIANSQNITDANGLKQGVWQRKYSNGNLMYKATFVNDTIVGEMLRFHSNGQKMAQILYDSKGEWGNGQLFSEKGKKIAEGKFNGS